MLNVVIDRQVSSATSTPSFSKKSSTCSNIESKVSKELSTQNLPCQDRVKYFTAVILDDDVKNDVRIRLRNDFIRKNIYSLRQIADSSASKVRFKFRQLSREDLIAYAFEGIIKALEHAFGHQASIATRYLAIYAYENCLHGALAMVGICRRRKPSNSSLNSDFTSLLPFSPDDIIQIQDDQFYDIHLQNSTESEMIYRIDSKLLTTHIKSKELRDLFQLLLLGYTPVEIRSTLNINDRHYFYLRKKLFNILSRTYEFQPRQKAVPLKDFNQFYKSKNCTDHASNIHKRSSPMPSLHIRRYAKTKLHYAPMYTFHRQPLSFLPHLNHIKRKNYRRRRILHPIR